MARCIACGVEILDHTAVCPLCGDILEKDPEENPKERKKAVEYPNLVIRKRKMIRAAEIIFLCGVILEVVLVVLNRILTPDILWCSISGAGILYVMLLMFILSRKHMDVRLRFLVMALAGVLVVGTVDWFSGFGGWTISFALPLALLFMDAVILTLILTHQREFRSYLWLELLNLGISILPLLWVHSGYQKFYVVAVVANIAAWIEFLATLGIGGVKSVTEFRRRFFI